MKKYCMIQIAIAALTTACISAQAAPANDDGWKFEIVPHAWLMNMDGDVTVGSQKVSVDNKFSDMLDKVDVAGSIFFNASKGPMSLWAEGDFFALSEDVDTKLGEVTLESKTHFLAGGAGCRLPEMVKNLSIDVFGGARYTRLVNSLQLEDEEEVEEASNIVDPVLGLQLGIQLMESVRLDLPASISAFGQSDLVYDLQPNVQVKFTDMWSGCIGYRYLHYDYDGDDAAFKGSFNGLMIGVGITL